MKLSDLNFKVFAVLVMLPLAIILGVILYIANFGFGMMEVLMIIITYYVCNISIGIGLHRLWAHNAYKTHPIIEFILSLTCAATFQGPILAWSSDHSLHHTFTDKKQDPHSPLKYQNKFLGFFWSHMGWMLFEKGTKKIDRGTLKRLGRNKIVMWQFRNYWKIALFMNFIVPIAIGLCINFSWQYVGAAVLFMGLGRALQQQATFMVNSTCHFLGTKKYQAGTAGDIWWLFFLLLGENWHNFHHAFARDYRNGHKWYHLDIHKWIIYTLERLGLAYDLVRTPEERIVAKAQDTSLTVKESTLNFLENAKEQANLIANTVKRTLHDIESSNIRERVNQKMLKKMIELEKMSANFVDNLRNVIGNIDISINKHHQKLQKKITAKLFSLEESAIQMNIKLPKLLCYNAPQ